MDRTFLLTNLIELHVSTNIFGISIPSLDKQFPLPVYLILSIRPYKDWQISLQYFYHILVLKEYCIINLFIFGVKLLSLLKFFRNSIFYFTIIFVDLIVTHKSKRNQYSSIITPSILKIKIRIKFFIQNLQYNCD